MLSPLDWKKRQLFWLKRKHLCMKPLLRLNKLYSDFYENLKYSPFWWLLFFGENIDIKVPNVARSFWNLLIRDTRGFWTQPAFQCKTLQLNLRVVAVNLIQQLKDTECRCFVNSAHSSVQDKGCISCVDLLPKNRVISHKVIWIGEG
jgi:hypothetical protein